MQTSDREWGDFAKQLLEGKLRDPRKGNSNDQAHPPITPTKFVNNLNGNEKKVYEFIARHFLACCSDDARGAETVVTATVGNEVFKCKGLMIQEKNYLEVYPYKKWFTKTIPVFQPNTEEQIHSLKMEESETTAPDLISEPELIQIMDKKGIGTDATIAQHIKTIQDRKYATKVSGKFEPTKLGIALVVGYDSMGFFFSKPHYRAQIEKDMTQISRGTRTKEEVIRDSLEMYKKMFQKSTELASKLDSVMSVFFGNGQVQSQVVAQQYSHQRKNFSLCGICETKMILRYNQTSRDASPGARVLDCQNCTKVWNLPRVGTVKVLVPHTLCPLCGFQVLEITKDAKSKKNNGDSNTYTICPSCYTSPPSSALPPASPKNLFCWQCIAECPLAKGKSSIPVRPCPNCQSTMTVKQRKDQTSYFLSCSGYSKGCKTALTLPSCRSVSPTKDVCPKCPPAQGGPINLLRFTFAPAQHVHHNIFTQEYTACVGGCDKNFNSLLLEINDKDLKPFFERTRQVLSPTLDNSSSRPLAPQQQQSPTFSNSSIGMPPSSYSSNFQNRNATNSSQGNTEGPSCNCGNKTTLKTVMNEKNFGKGYYSCRDCNFFIWEEAYQNGGASANAGRSFPNRGNSFNNSFNNNKNKSYGNSGGYNSRSTSYSNNKSHTSNQGNKGSCFICGDPGHWSTTCPQKKNK